MTLLMLEKRLFFATYWFFVMLVNILNANGIYWRSNYQ